MILIAIPHETVCCVKFRFIMWLENVYQNQSEILEQLWKICYLLWEAHNSQSSSETTDEPTKFLCSRGQSGIFKREKQTLINYFSTENQLLQQNNGLVWMKWWIYIGFQGVYWPSFFCACCKCVRIPHLFKWPIIHQLVLICRGTIKQRQFLLQFNPNEIP